MSNECVNTNERNIKLVSGNLRRVIIVISIT